MRTPGQRVGRPAAVLAASLLFLLPTWAPPAGGASGPVPTAGERAVLVDLYVLGSKLEHAQADLAAVEARIAALEGERRQAQLELRAARGTLAVAQRQLGGQVRVLYEHDEPDILAVILGASSLDDLITGLDGLSRAAGATSAVVEQTHAARTRVSRVLRTLSERRRALDRLHFAARARAQELERVQAERLRYLARLREQTRLDAAQIASAQARARAAQASSRTATIVARTSGSVASFAAQPLLTQPDDPAFRPAAGQRLTVLATAYSLPGSTASGLPVGPGIVAVDPTIIPLGTRMTIPGYGPGVAADTGTAIKGLRIDVWFRTLAQAQAWGLRRVTITLH